MNRSSLSPSLDRRLPWVLAASHDRGIARPSAGPDPIVIPGRCGGHALVPAGRRPQGPLVQVGTPGPGARMMNPDWWTFGILGAFGATSSWVELGRVG